MSELNLQVIVLNNASPPIYQSPVVATNGLPYGNVGAIEREFSATGRIEGLASPDSLKLLLFAANHDESAWTIGSDWVTTPDANGSWSLSVGQSAPEFACAVMTGEAYKTYMAENFPDGSPVTVKSLPSATRQPGDVLYSSPLPASWGMSLFAAGRTIPAGSSSGSQFDAPPYSTHEYQQWQVTADPTASHDATNSFWNERSHRNPGLQIFGARPDGTRLGGMLALGLYNYLDDIYFYSGSGPTMVPASHQFPASIKTKQVGSLVPCTDNAVAQLEVSVLPDQITVKVLNLNLSPSIAKELLEVSIKMEKIFIKALFALIE